MCSELARKMLRRVLDLTKANKKGKSFDILGYTAVDLKDHISSLFADGMSWSNHGEWHIDHIIPVSMMVKSGVEDPKRINALKNLRPLWAVDNLKRRFTELNEEERTLFKQLEPVAFTAAGL